METPGGLADRNGAGRLGNFLSGMETLPFHSDLFHVKHSLETSLVEWKPAGECEHAPGHSRTLETSLVEWKRFCVPRLAGNDVALETSLVEWKRYRLLGAL